VPIERTTEVLNTPFDNDNDFSVVVKLRERQPRPWRWEIYRAGRLSPVMQSAEAYQSAGIAHKLGQRALKLFLSECPPE
jgi:hypothetical protein